MAEKLCQDVAKMTLKTKVLFPLRLRKKTCQVEAINFRKTMEFTLKAIDKVKTLRKQVAKEIGVIDFFANPVNDQFTPGYSSELPDC